MSLLTNDAGSAADYTQQSSAAIKLLIESRAKDLGNFAVRRVLPHAQQRLVGPFIFFDHFGPVEFAPSAGVDVRPHPHINLSTVSYLFEGAFLHRDSLGSVQRIEPGAINWMTAGRGIVHSERTPPELRAVGHRLHGLQLWIALPREHEEDPPSFRHYPADSLPTLDRQGANIRLLAGAAYGATSPVLTHSPLCYLDIELQAGAYLSLPDAYSERAVYVVDGEPELNGQLLVAHQMAVLNPGTAELRATQTTRAMFIAGAPLDGGRYMWWNFVSSRKERIEQAKADWQSGRFEPVPGETEFISLPEK
jgi:redox-sensitive bicupin YhaK (pirin superfamily)